MLKQAIHPGEVLKDELAGLGITPTELARQIDVPANRMSQIIAGKRSITGDTALRLGHWFRTDPQFWMNLQTRFELVAAQKESGKIIQKLPTRPAERRAAARLGYPFVLGGAYSGRLGHPRMVLRCRERHAGLLRSGERPVP